MVHARSRLIGAAASLATVASLFLAVLAVPLSASAQTCPYNSTQGTCACPTSGSGTTCFGGQLYRSTDSTCQNDSRPCSANQQFSCASVSCTCNTAAYPCGGCTAASSTVGTTCSAPTGGQYTNICGACACPAGTTLCASGNRCVANRACPAGTTWDPCTDTCGTPNVLLSPGFTQNGFIDVAGDWRNRAGNFRLDYSNGAGVGDLYMASGKSLRVDGTGVTNLNIANYGVGGTGLNVNFPAGSQLCFGASCRGSWPSTTDFNPTYVNVGGDTMSGLLTLNGGLLMSTGAGAGRVLTSDASGNASWQTLNGLTGSGTANAIPKFTSSTALGNSVASDTGTGLSIAGTASSGAYGLSVTNIGTGGGIDVSTNSAFNGVPALRVTNSGAGRGLEVMGGSGGNAAFIRGAGDNVALEAANYNYSGTNTLGTIMQIRRGTGAGIAPAAGMGGVIGFPLQSDSAGSYTAGPALGGAIQSLSPWKTALVFIPSTYAGMVEKMRLTTEGYLGIGTSSPTAMLQVNGGSTALGLSSTASGQYSLAAGYGPTASGSYSVALGDRNTATNNTSIALGAQVDATGYYGIGIGNYAAATGTGSIAIGGGIDVSRKMTVSGGATIGLGYGSTIPTLVVTSAPNTAGTYGKVGVAAQAPQATLAVGGNGTNVYATDLWVENNMHVQGNESVGSGRGRLRVGTAWNLPGIYAEGNSVGQTSDLVLGASSDLVQINAGTFGRPYNASWLALWGSRIGDAGGGTLSIRSGGSVVSFDGGDTVVFGGNAQLGGVSRGSWPSLQTTTTYCQFNAGSGAGWKACYCPGGYEVTGWYGYNCKSNGGEWECSSSAPYGSTAVQVYHDSAGTAYVWAQCARVN
ncbi:MAG TPA: hypothetical protein VL426_00590 [Candidatus Binatia bacterium]|nr:hypothetical protein [Candidatus Binatia bacterium]